MTIIELKECMVLVSIPDRWRTMRLLSTSLDVCHMQNRLGQRVSKESVVCVFLSNKAFKLHFQMLVFSNSYFQIRILPLGMEFYNEHISANDSNLD